LLDDDPPAIDDDPPSPMGGHAFHYPFVFSVPVRST
jgi:hypothetical protein